LRRLISKEEYNADTSNDSDEQRQNNERMAASLTIAVVKHSRTADTETSLTAFKCTERLGHDMPSPNERAEELRLAVTALFTFTISRQHLWAKEMFAISAGLPVCIAATR